MSDYIPQELVVKIFIKLPVKSLLRFRSVSKSWCALISSPDFIRKYTLGLDKTTQKVLITNDVMSGKDIYTLHQEDQLPLSSSEGYRGITAVEFPRVGFQIAGSCNGILCLCNISLTMYLWNFSVRRQLMIPMVPLRGNCIGDVTVGFGFDPITKDYKILTIHYGDNIGDALEVYLYTLNTASWSEIAPPATTFYHLSCDSRLVNETLYWVASESPNVHHRVIVTFNLSSHVFGRISLPEPSWKFRHLAPYNGSLALMCAKGNDIWIWVRTESNHVPTWSVFLKLASPKFHAGKILQPTFKGDLLIRTFPNFQTDSDIRIYNTRTGILSTLLRFEAYCNIWMNTYVESLELLDRGTPCGETIKWTEPKKLEDWDLE